MKKLLVGLALVIVLTLIFYISIYKHLGFSSISSFSVKEVETGFVTKVIDGDTIIVRGESIRLLGIDANEKGEKCYKEAKTKMEGLVLNKEVILEKDVKDKDQYKRLLRYVFVEEDGIKINVNLILVKDGLAIARFYEDKKYKKEILEAEIKARENKIGCKWN